MRRFGALVRPAFALTTGIVLAAHVGSPDAFFSGMAGPYAVDIVIRAPQVVPGLAEVIVHAPDPRVSRVVIRPVFWRAGTKGAPVGDEARPIKDAPGSYSGKLWLMAAGSYIVDVTVSGSAGAGTANVPVAAVATGQLALSPILRSLLVVLGLLLVAGVITAVYAAAGESQVPPGETISPQRRRRARTATLIATPLMALIVFGGARWWGAEATTYRATIDKPLDTRTTIRDAAGLPPMLTLEVTDSIWQAGFRSPLMPDHGKLAHMFIVRADSRDVFAHLHPTLHGRSTFTTALPPLPAGRYRLYADVVHQNGYQRTLTDSFKLGMALPETGISLLDADDARYAGGATSVSTATAASLGDGFTIVWSGDRHPVVGRVGALRFALRDTSGSPIPVDSYLGMAGHAIVMRGDGSVFVHLHPRGTGSMATATAFALRDRGDTTADGLLRLDSMSMPSEAPRLLSEIAFPYAFPRAGAYRVWVQLRVRGTVRTAAFDVAVSGESPH